MLEANGPSAGTAAFGYVLEGEYEWGLNDQAVKTLKAPREERRRPRRNCRIDSGGASVEDHFLIGHEIWAVNHNGQLMSLVVEEMEGEEGEMCYAILDFLRRRGTKGYQSHEEYLDQRIKS